MNPYESSSPVGLSLGAMRRQRTWSARAANEGGELSFQRGQSGKIQLYGSVLDASPFPSGLEADAPCW